MPDYLAILSEFARRQDLAFRDLTLLRTALTHRSFLNEHADLAWEDNERLEYLGDAVLDFMLAEYLYLHFPSASEGDLTALRAALVRRETLARFAREMRLGEVLLMGHGEIDTGGRDRPATLCAAFEALVGGVYLDQGLEGASQLVLPLMEQELADARVEAADKDPKSRLQERAQGMLGQTPRYRAVRAEGPDHAKIFTVQVFIGDMVYGEGEGPSKQIAAQQAALDALAKQDQWPLPEIEA
jgi:ribonuclease III